MDTLYQWTAMIELPDHPDLPGVGSRLHLCQTYSGFAQIGMERERAGEAYGDIDAAGCDRLIAALAELKARL